MKIFIKKFFVLLCCFLLLTNAIYAVEIYNYDEYDEFDDFGVSADEGVGELSLSDIKKYGNFEYVNDDSGVYITRYTGSESTVDVPSQINGQNVLMLYTESFSYCNTVKRVNIPSTINSIYDDAFINCASLEWIEVDSNNTTYASDEGILYDKTFAYLVTCPDGRVGSVDVVEGCLYICDYAFFLCDKVTSVNVSSTVIDIAQNTFWCTPSLVTITIDSANNEYIEEDGIVYTKDKTLVVKCVETKSGTVTIPSTVTQIGDYAFCDCTKITGSVTIPNNVKRIGEYAFSNCSALNGTLTFHNSLNTLGMGAFYGCENLKDIVWGSGISDIPDYAFAYCKSLTALTLPNSIKTIGECAFFNCTSVESLSFGRNVKTIDNWAFDYLTSLKGNLIIPDSVQSIGDAVFCNCPNIDGYIVIGSGLLDIGVSNFYSSSNAKGIVFKGNAPTMEYASFTKPNVIYYHLQDKTGFDNKYLEGKDIRIYALNPVINFIIDGETYKSVTLSSYGQTVDEFNNPELNNLNFLGWYYDESYTNEFSFSDTFMNNTNIYAKTEVKNVLSFADEEVKIEINEQIKLEVDYDLEEGATYSDIQWSSQDESVAIVDNQGNVTCVSTGETEIRATYKEAVATIKIIVWQDVDRINIIEDSITIEVGDELELECDYNLLGDATFDDIEWISSDDDIVSVINGKITANSHGNATIAAMYKDIIDTIDITVLKKNELNINEKSTVLQKGEYYDIPFDYYFNDGATNNDILWTSSNTNVAKVSNGKVYANLDGNAVITATYKDVSVSIDIKVVNPDTISFSSNSLILENTISTYELPYTWYSYQTTKEEIVWTTSNPSVATVEDGILTINDIGTVTIGAVCGKASAAIDIKIIKPNELNIVEDEIILRYNNSGIVELDIDYYFNDDATKDDIIYSTSNNEVIDIQNNILIQKGIGETIVTATYKDVSDNIKITIVPQDYIAFSKYGYMLKPNEMLTLDYSSYFYDQMSLNAIQFTSSNEEVATVDDNGVVTTLSEGETTITAKNGDIEASVEIIVSPLNYLRGDMNFDGYINSTDAAIVLDKFKNGDASKIDLIVGDLSGDTFLNSTDAALILDIYKN